MLLRNLVDVYPGNPEPKAHSRSVRKNLYVIALKSDGTPANTQVLPIPEMNLLLPDGGRSGAGTNPYLFSDKIQYSLPAEQVNLLRTDGNGEIDTNRADYLDKPGDVTRYHNSWMALVDSFLEQHPNHDDAKAVKAFYKHHFYQIDFSAIGQEKLLQSVNLTFTVDNRYISDDKTVQDFWIAQKTVTSDKEDEQCGICGQMTTLVEFSPIALKGIPGAQSMGAALVTTNSNAFESYGLGKLTTRMCGDCAEAWSHQINDMVRDRDSRLINVDEKTVTMAWAQNNKVRTSLDFEALLASGFAHKDDTKEEAQEAIRRLKSIWTGKNIPLSDVDIHFLTLKGNSGRVAVQEYWRGDLQSFETHIADWHSRQDVPDDYTDRNVLQNIGKAKGSSAQTSKSLLKINGLEAAIIRQAYTGRPLTRRYLPQVIRLINKDILVKKGETTKRQGKISPVLIQLINIMNPTPITKLDTEHPSQAYHMGRLLALAENIQQKALGDVNKSLAATHYNKLSTYPTRALPQVLRKMQAHIQKLQKSQAGLAFHFERTMAECITRTEGIDAKLTPQQQGEFAIGYYAQKHYRAPKSDETATGSADTSSDENAETTV